MNAPICDCGREAKLTTGAVLYPHLAGDEKIANKMFWVCRPCSAHVGCHPKGTVPLGTLATAEVRAARQRAHAAFDPLWHAKARIAGIGLNKARRLAYGWLSMALNVPPEKCHISMFNVDQCDAVVAAVAALRKSG